MSMRRPSATSVVPSKVRSRGSATTVGTPRASKRSLQDQELAPGRHLAEVRDQDRRRAGRAAPLGVAGQQGVEEVRREAEVGRLEALAEARRDLEAVEHLAEVLGVGEAGRRFGVVLGERQRVGQQERVQPRRRAGPPVARIDAGQPRLLVGQPDPPQQLGLDHRGGDDALADGGDRLGDGPDPRLVGGVEEERPQERAQRPAAEGEPGGLHPAGEIGPVGGRLLDIRADQRVPDVGRRGRRAGTGAARGKLAHRVLVRQRGWPTNPDVLPQPSICSHCGQGLVGGPFRARSTTSFDILSRTSSK